MPRTPPQMPHGADFKPRKGITEYPECVDTSSRALAAIFGAWAGGYVGGLAGAVGRRPLVGTVVGVAVGAAAGWHLLAKILPDQQCMRRVDAEALAPASSPATERSLVGPRCPISHYFDAAAGQCLKVNIG